MFGTSNRELRTPYPAFTPCPFLVTKAMSDRLLARIIHDGSWRNCAVALRDGHAESRGPEAYLNSTSRGRVASLPAEGAS